MTGDLLSTYLRVFSLHLARKDPGGEVPFLWITVLVLFVCGRLPGTISLGQKVRTQCPSVSRYGSYSHTETYTL